MDLIRELTQTNSVSGNEKLIHDIIIREIKDFADEIYTDDIGNLIVRKCGTGKRLLISAHTDEVGLMANYIDENGFVRFALVGDVKLPSLLYSRVAFDSGVTGVVCHRTKVDSIKDLSIKDMYIDIGSSSEEETRKSISSGDVASFCGEFQRKGKRICSNSLDNKVGVYALIQSIRKIQNNTLDLYFVFSSQEELGCRGAKISAYNIEPDIALSIDLSEASDTPGNDEKCLKLGGGVAIKLMDKSVITHKGLRETILRIAEDNNITHQLEIMSDISTESGAMQLVKKGVVSGALTIPARYIHTPSEMVDTDDVESCINLICEICKKDFILF